MMTIEEVLAAEAAASEANPDAELKPGTVVTRGHARSKTLQIRLNETELADLTLAASQQGVPVSSLARDYLLQGMIRRSEAPRDVLSRIRHDLDQLAAREA